MDGKREQKMEQKKPLNYDMGDPSRARNEFEALHSFQRIMWDKLKANTHKGSWHVNSPEYLLKRLREEVDELEKAILRPVRPADASGPFSIDGNAEEVAKEAADVANFAMMIADVMGGLPYQRRG